MTTPTRDTDTGVSSDAASRLTSRTDRLGRRRDFSYDALDRPTGEVWLDDQQTTVNTLTYTHDAVGNLLTAADGHGTYSYTYDALNRATLTEALFALTLTASYDAVGNRTLVEDSQGGVTTSSYDALHRLTQRTFGGAEQTPLRFDQTWTARGQLASVSRYSDLAGTTQVGASSSTYDAVGQLTHLLHEDGSSTTLSEHTYTYDAVRRLSSDTSNSNTTSYAYDAIHQLTDDEVSTYSYDGTGNRTNAGYATGDNNQLTTDGTWTYSYDAEGHRTKKSQGASAETWTYGYDHRNQLIWAEQRATDGGTLQLRLDYSYDVFGRRIQVERDDTSSTEISRFGYDGPNVWVDLDASNDLVMRYVRPEGTDALGARISSGGTAAWYLVDRQGSVRALTDASGVVQDTLSYDGFGNIVSETSPSFGDRYKYTGKERDGDTGLQLNLWRWYDPATGRWTSEDPLGFEAGDVNLYRYVGNAPTLATDPTGRKSLPAKTVTAAQKIANSGVPIVPTKERAGPRVGQWFAMDMVVHLASRRGHWGVVPPTRTVRNDVVGFRNQARDQMSHKWIHFGSPATGRGVNTVVIGDYVLPKKQLGNIMFGFIAEMMPIQGKGMPAFAAAMKEIQNVVSGKKVDPFIERVREKTRLTKLSNNPEKMMFLAYKIVPYYPDRKKWGTFPDKVIYRADNLAAFGVGRLIAEKLMLEVVKAEKLKFDDPKATLGKKDLIRLHISAMTTTKEGQKKLGAILHKVLNLHVFNNKPEAKKLMEKAVDTFRSFQPTYNSPPPKILLGALTFTPDYGGFNTNSLDKTHSPPFTPEQPGGNTIGFEQEMWKEFKKETGSTDHKRYERWRKDKYEKWTDAMGFRPSKIKYPK